MRTAPALLDFLSPVSVIPGTGPKRISALLESGISTVGDLLYHFPRRYVDRSVITPISDTGPNLGLSVTLCGTIGAVTVERGKKERLRAVLYDDTGTIDLLWFQGIRFMRNAVRTGTKVIATGKVSSFNDLQIIHPSIESVDSVAALPVLPLYGLTTAMRDAGIRQHLRRKMIQWVLKNCIHYPHSLPAAIEKRHAFPPIERCLAELHFPTSMAALDSFRERIKFEELYKLALDLHFNRRKFHLPGRTVSPGALHDRFVASLPFTLTADQQRAVHILLDDCASSRRMHRLLQGDVGCGKTVVAFIAALPSLANGLQVVWMAPTEILAEQTWKTVSSWLEPLGFDAALFTGSSKGSQEYPSLCKALADGTCQFVVGTHALFQPGISYHEVGIFIIDEQHRFGANQRLQLHEKDNAADFLLMSATPIPQTLAQTLYGDLDIVSIRSLPPGRRTVSTHCVMPEKRNAMETFIADELSKGRQCFYIVPRIEKDESTDDLAAAVVDIETAYARLTSGTLRPFSASFVHGKVDIREKTRTLDAFYSGRDRILVATSVVEVGINVPNATVIVIENPERFGLAQLHQLRGRVGRGTDVSWCFLMVSEPIDSQTLQKLSRFCKMHDGFAVAELDLDHRGPGEINGYRQSGWDDLIMADILRDTGLFATIRQEIGQLLSEHL